MKRLPLLILMISGVFAGAVNVNAAEFDFGGFLQLHAAARTSHVDCPPETECTVPFNEQRLRLNAEGSGFEGAAGFVGKLELVHDSALDDTDADMRELYADYNSDRYTARAGRQIMTWGVGDLLFINDRFSKNWVAFFSGLPLEYLKRGSDSVKINAFPAFADVEVILARFRKDKLPDDRQFVIESPISPSLPRNIDDPSDPEINLRLSRYLGNWDAAAYFSRTHFRAPALRVVGENVAGEFPRLDTYGASLSGPFRNGVLNLEAGYYDSREDRDGTDPSIENSQTRFLVGYSRQVAEDTTLGVQGFARWMHDYDDYKRTLPPGFPKRDRLRTVATLRFTQFYLHQTLKFNVFAFWGLSEGDGYIIPSVKYFFSDSLWGEAGANLFLGDGKGQFGALGENDNVYLTLRYAF
ncbi:MAG: hypothetical protein ABFS22_09125 [Pseudomonadota bacterium]